MSTLESVPKRGRLIAMAGIDGAGKSTLATALCAALTNAGHDTILVGKNTVDVPSKTVSQYLEAVNGVVYRREAGVGQACGDHYWLFALAAWYSLQDRFVVAPALQAGTHVILDSSYHKILARYAVSPGAPAKIARQVFAHLSGPDIVLFLRVSAEEALHRKGEFTAVEAGCADPSRQHFISHQDKMAAELARQAGDTWAPIEVAAKNPAAVLGDALAILEQRGLIGHPALPGRAGEGPQ